MTRVTDLLRKIESGQHSALNELLELVYEQLRAMASSKMLREKPGQLLDTTALVHESFLRMTQGSLSHSWQSRRHFFAAAGMAMERILVEQARRRSRQRYGGGHEQVDISAIEVQISERNWQQNTNIVELSDALTELGKQHPAIADLVRLRYFVGLTIEQAAEVCDISVRTANRNWAYAKAWLYERMQ